jgi:hypothetical protein
MSFLNQYNYFHIRIPGYAQCVFIPIFSTNESAAIAVTFGAAIIGT